MSMRNYQAGLSALSRQELQEIWRLEIDPDVPAKLGRKTIIRIIINNREWKASGQSRDRYQKRLKRLIDAKGAARPRASEGSRLVRHWHGQEHIVDVLPNGYHWNGKVWRSLSAIAKEITGAKWSGPRFFGIAP